MRITIAGNTSAAYYCVEKLCRSGFNVAAVILPEKGNIKSTDTADFSNLAGEFDFQQILLQSKKDFKDDIHTDVLIKIEWPDNLNIPVKPSKATLTSNLQGQFCQEQLVDIASEIYRGMSKYEIQLIMENDSKSGVSKVVDSSEVEINVFDDVRSVKAKVVARFFRLLNDLLQNLKKNGRMPKPKDRPLSLNRISVKRAIDWNRTTKNIYNLVRSLTHHGTGVHTWYEGNKINIWRGHYFDTIGREYENAEPGTIIDVFDELGVVAKTADSLFLVTRIQPFGAPELPAWVWAESAHVKSCDKFEYLAENLETANL